MKIAVVGTGYVGLITGTIFAHIGHDVTCIDVDKEKIENLVRGILPIYEPGLNEMVKECVINGRLHFSTDLSLVLDECNAVFSAVGTPPDEDGSADLKYVLDVARTIGRYMTHYNVLITKSTVPVGTADKVRNVIQDELNRRSMAIDFDVVSNPEFLKEGHAIKDCLHPDRIVIGADSERAKNVMADIYEYFATSNYPIMYTDVHSAEMIKYASNSMLAARISFMNEIANLCDKVGADVEEVAKGMGMDRRIGPAFLNAGCGYGGSCFPKDVKALIHTGYNHNCSMGVLNSVVRVNESQKYVVFNKLSKEIGKDLTDKTIAIWGLAFKPNTDDMREATSLVTIEQLRKANAKEIRVYDPISMDECKRRIGDTVTYCKSAYEACEGADALLVITEWDEFKMLDMDKVASLMNNKLIIDGRNIFKNPPKGFKCIGIGKGLRYKKGC